MKLRILLNTLKEKPYNLSQAQAIDLITFLLNCERNYFWMNLELDYWASNQKLQKVFKLLEQNYPIEYITQKKHFLGCDFYVDNRVLIPRDETEGLTKLALDWLKKYQQAKIIDLGTGSGVIGLTLKRFFPLSTVWLSDNSWLALQVAQKNAQHQKLDVSFIMGDFLKPLQDLNIEANLIVVNPPYIDKSTPNLEPNLQFEPQTALFAPNNGLFFYQQLFANWKTISDLRKPFAILMEFGYDQKEKIEALLNQQKMNNFFKVNFYRDWNNHWRYLMLEMDNDVNAFTN